MAGIAPHILTFANEKGGTGKSTTAVHVAVALAAQGNLPAARKEMEIALAQLDSDIAMASAALAASQAEAARITESAKKQIGAERTAIITFVMFEAAYYCEIMRAGIQSIPRGQVSAGQALGLTHAQTMINIVLPQAFRNMVPVLLTQSIILFQDVSLVYVLSITDFVGAASKVAQRDGRMVEMYGFVAVVYFVMSFTLSLLVKRLERNTAVAR